MTPTFAQNARMFQHAQAMHVAMLKLSMADYVALKVTTIERRTNIQIDRPFDGVEHTLTHHAEKLIGSCEFMGCRLWWHVKQPEHSHE